MAKIGRLSLEDNENYCMGGPGVIFSKGLLSEIGEFQSSSEFSFINFQEHKNSKLPEE